MALENEITAKIGCRHDSREELVAMEELTIEGKKDESSTIR
jgi:hypothetical protein